MADVATRLGAKVVAAEAEWGAVVSPEAVRGALARCASPRLVAIVHAETSTGAWQSVPEIAKLAHDAGALIVLDTVTSLGGCPVDIDDWGIDAAYSGTQKCISAPPGLAPVTFNQRAVSVFQHRKVKVQSWYLDLNMIQSYWGSERLYHHTAPISMNYALHEALSAILREGLDQCHQRQCPAAQGTARGHHGDCRGLPPVLLPH